MKRLIVSWLTVIMLALMMGCGGGDGDDKGAAHGKSRARHLIKFVPSTDGETNEIVIIFATDANGNLLHMVRLGQEVSFDPNCNRKVEVLIESNCEGWPEVQGGGPGLRKPFCNPAVFHIPRGGDVMIPGLIIDDREIYSVNIDFVDVEGPSGAITADRSRGLISWGCAALQPTFSCDQKPDPPITSHTQ